MATTLGRSRWFLAACAVLTGAMILAAPAAQAWNRKAYSGLRQEAEAYCKKIKKQKLYECSVEKCPCKEGLRMVRKFDKLRTRGACVCASPVARSAINSASATDYCIEWNYRRGGDNDRCFVVTDHRCPAGARELDRFALVDYGPSQLACRGVPPKPKDDGGAKDRGKPRGRSAKG